MRNRGNVMWFVFGFAFLMLVISLSFGINVETIQGNELGVKETWSGGVSDEPLFSKTHIFWPFGFTVDVTHYDMSSQVYVMNDKTSDEFAEGRQKDSYQIQSQEGQDMYISLNVRWRFDPDKIVHIHKTVRENFEEKVLRPDLLRVVKDEGTKREAIVAYSGLGLVELQKSIEDRLKDPEGDLRASGIIVENFVIEGIKLDPKYIEEIKQRQVSVQAELRARQEEKTALAEAQKAKAEAQADFNRQVVAAERDKAIGVLKAQEDAEVRIVDAQARKQETILQSEAEKEAAAANAEAILAVGKAEAEAIRVKMGAYGEPGANNFVTMEVAKSMSEAFKNIDGYLPQDMNITMLSSNFMDSVKGLMSGKAKLISE